MLVPLRWTLVVIALFAALAVFAGEALQVHSLSSSDYVTTAVDLQPASTCVITPGAMLIVTLPDDGHAAGTLSVQPRSALSVTDPLPPNAVRTANTLDLPLALMADKKTTCGFSGAATISGGPSGLTVTRRWNAIEVQAGMCMITVQSPGRWDVSIAFPRGVGESVTIRDADLVQGKTFTCPVTFADAMPAAYYPRVTLVAMTEQPQRYPTISDRGTEAKGGLSTLPFTLACPAPTAYTFTYAQRTTVVMEELRTAPAEEALPKSISCQRYKHGTGAWNAFAEGFTRLLTFANQTLVCDQTITPIKSAELRNADPAQQPSLLYCYIDEAFTLTNDDVTALQRYLRQGGMLWIDSRPDPVFRDLVKREMAKVLPDAPLLPISALHTTTAYLYKLSSPGVAEDVIGRKNYGCAYAGRLAVLYTPGNFGHLYASNKPDADQYFTAQYQMGVNFFAYAASRGNRGALAPLLRGGDAAPAN